MTTSRGPAAASARDLFVKELDSLVGEMSDIHTKLASYCHFLSQPNGDDHTDKTLQDLKYLQDKVAKVIVVGESARDEQDHEGVAGSADSAASQPTNNKRRATAENGSSQKKSRPSVESLYGHFDGDEMRIMEQLVKKREELETLEANKTKENAIQVLELRRDFTRKFDTKELKELNNKAVRHVKDWRKHKDWAEGIFLSSTVHDKVIKNCFLGSENDFLEKCPKKWPKKIKQKPGEDRDSHLFACGIKPSDVPSWK